MDMSEKGKCSSEKNEGHQNYNKAGVSSEWQFSNAEVGFVRYQTCSTPCPSVSMGDSFNPSLWSISTSSTNLGLCANDNPAISKPVPGTSLLGVCWNPSDSLSRGGNFLQSGPGILPPSLSHFPADSAFVERAARLSCFNATGLGSMANPFSTSHSLSPYSNASRGVADARIQKIDINMTESLRDIASLPANHGSCDKSPMTEQKKGSMHDIESDEVDFSGNCHDNAVDLASAAEDSSSKNLGAKKRKRPNEDAAKDQTRGDPQISSETETKKNSLTAAAVKPNGKQRKNVSESPKEDYIHVRARHGQATNSHSLAERVRREKISQRMKFLQELVPGCSKVTGKAVMLDEIINYVQSLQQQVEFLSMKLAAVNPRLDSNIETLLSKDFLQSHGAPSSAIGFSSDMVNPQRHLSQQGLVQTGISGNLNSPNAFGRAINSQLNLYKGPTTQMFNTWDEELQNVMKMATFSNNPLNSQEFNDKSRDGFHL